MDAKGLFLKDKTIGKINKVQLGLISTSISDVVIEASLVSPPRNQTALESGSKLDLFLCSHKNRIVQYRIFPISGFTFPCRPISGPAFIFAFKVHLKWAFETLLAMQDCYVQRTIGKE